MKKGYFKMEHLVEDIGMFKRQHVDRLLVYAWCCHKARFGKKPYLQEYPDGRKCLLRKGQLASGQFSMAKELGFYKQDKKGALKLPREPDGQKVYRIWQWLRDQGLVYLEPLGRKLTRITVKCMTNEDTMKNLLKNGAIPEIVEKSKIKGSVTLTSEERDDYRIRKNNKKKVGGVRFEAPPPGKGDKW